MRVVVTGASGRLGRIVMRKLAERGDDAVGLDLEPGPRVVQADLGDAGAVFSVLAGAGAVVHLGAIPAPGSLPDAIVYAKNVTGTFHVFDAAAKLGIRRVVSASSLSAYGYPFQRVWSEPDYFPLNEAHPLRPQDPYGLSKQAGEQIAEAFARAGDGSAVSLRFSHLVSEETVPRWRQLMADRPRTAAASLWSHVYDDDVADACLRCLDVEVDGHLALLLTAAVTMAPQPTNDLLDEFFPHVPRTPGDDPHWSLVDCSLARETIGWEPR